MIITTSEKAHIGEKGEQRSYVETMVGLLGWVGAIATAQLQSSQIY